MAETVVSTDRRKYHRRSDAERIADLEARILDLKKRQQSKEKKNDPVVKDIPRIQKHLRKFAQLAIDNGRMDVSNSTMAFVAQLERIKSAELAKEEARRASHASDEEYEELEDDGDAA